MNREPFGVVSVLAGSLFINRFLNKWGEGNLGLSVLLFKAFRV